MADVFGIGTMIGSGASIAANFGITRMNNEEAMLREKMARNENYLYNEQAANMADIRTRALYTDLYSPQAQLEQLKAAGLSPSLFYGDGGGISGQSGAQGAGASGIAPNVFGMSPIDLTQISKTAAETEAIKAQTDKTKAETETIDETRQPQIQKLLAETGHEKAAAAAATTSAEGMKLDNYLKEHTQDANIFTICELADKTAYEAAKMYNEMRSAKVLADLDENLFETNLQKGKEELNLLVDSIKLNEQQQQYLRNEVLMSFDTIMQKWKELDIKEKEQTSYTDWIEAKIPMLEKELEIELKRLGVEKTKIVVNAVTDCIKGIGTTAIAISAFKGGNRTNMPNLPKDKTLGPKGNAVPKTRGYNIYENNNLWAY